jgi:hypothetical protein
MFFVVLASSEIIAQIGPSFLMKRRSVRRVAERFVVAENKAEAIRRLSKKWLETGDDAILDELNNVTHENVYTTVPERRLRERYRDSRLELHFHFFGDSGPTGEVLKCKVHDFCAIIHYDTKTHVGSGVTQLDGEGKNSGLISVLEPKHFAHGFASENMGEGERSVLINVHEMVQTPQGMVTGPAPGRLVRLQPLNQCHGLNGYAIEPVLPSLISKPAGRVADGKLTSILLDSTGRIKLDQLPNEMVESRTEIMQTFTDDNAETQRESGEVGVESDHSGIVGINTFLGNETAFVLMPRKIGAYACKMFFCPDDFLIDAV